MFALDYAGWAVAPGFFLAPWLLLKHQTTSGGVLEALLSPPLWNDQTVQHRLVENVQLWFLSYTFAWVLFHAATSNSATKGFKFNPKSPPPLFVLSEMARSFCGVVVLTVFQIYVCAPFLPTVRATELPPLSEIGAWVLIVGLWADLHFYLGHRFLHEAPYMYTYVHKVHHRSHNVDPW
jgi:sterol desaturase/sphingolipid hydroxylase (fatty acid hydroxylase superfamily)